MKIKSDRIVYSGKYVSVLEDPRGVEFVQMKDEVLVVPLTSDAEVILSIEPSAAFDESSLVLPGGEVEVDEEGVETADRELREEIGYKARKLDFLGELRPFSKYLAVRSFVYLARDLLPSRLEGDENYHIETLNVPLQRFELLIGSGRLLDARVIASLYMARDLLDEGAGLNGQNERIKYVK